MHESASKDKMCKARKSGQDRSVVATHTWYADQCQLGLVPLLSMYCANRSAAFLPFEAKNEDGQEMGSMGWVWLRCCSFGELY